MNPEITKGLTEVPWPSKDRKRTKAPKPLGQSVNDEAYYKRKRRAAWLGLLSAATQFDSKHSDQRMFARNELRRCARVLVSMGCEPVPAPGDLDVE